MSRMDVNQSIAFYGTIIHSVDVKKPVVILENTVVAIKERKIVALQTGVEKKEAHQLISNLNIPIENFQILRTGEFIIPGLIDTHIHAPQYVNMGIGYDLTLLGWLDKYTFPTEAKFHDLEFASKVYSQVVKRTLQNGTTTASYFATIHLDASLLLAKIMNSYGQRGYVGKVCMDMNSPDNYVETTKDSLSSTRQFIESMRKEYGVAGIVAPCVTPRFAASCSKELMIGLAQLAKEFNAPIQTHISENEGEISWVKDIFKVPEYVDVYEQAGLMTEKTILAHCVFSNDKELDVMKKYGAGIAHCPNSNTSLTSGQMNSRKVLSKGVKLGLGTDVSGGYSCSILNSLREAIAVSRHVHFHNSLSDCIDYKEAFYLATLGGAKVLHLDDKIGNFEVGKEFDALVVNVLVDNSPFDLFGDNTASELLQRFLHCGDDRNIAEIYVAGRKIDFSK